MGSVNLEVCDSNGMGTEKLTTAEQEELLREAFRHQSTLTGFAYSMLRDWQLAEDVVQDALVEANRKWESFDSSKPIFPWVKGIVRLKCLETLRRRRRESLYGDTELLDLVEQRVSENVDDDFAARREEQMRALKTCMTKLNKQSLELLFGFYRERRSCDELAERMGRTVNAIYISLTRIRGRLRKCSMQVLRGEAAL